MFSGMPAMVRTRFSTPTIGREWMIGEMGEAGDRGRARTARCGSGRRCGGPGPTGPPRSRWGDPVRVVAIDGLVLEVEPEEGGAIDYREMRDRRRGGADAAAGDTDGEGADDPR